MNLLRLFSGNLPAMSLVLFHLSVKDSCYVPVFLLSWNWGKRITTRNNAGSLPLPAGSEILLDIRVLGKFSELGYDPCRKTTTRYPSLILEFP